MPLEEAGVPRWDQLKEALRRRLSPQAYATWIAQMSCVVDDGRKLTIGLPDTFSLNWVNDHYRHVLEEELGTDSEVELALEIYRQETGSAESSTPLESAQPPVVAAPAPDPAYRTITAVEPTPAADPADPTAGRLNPRYTFSSFVVGPANELAWTASHSVVENRSPRYCPLVIVGSVGLGKTHLLHAIGHSLLKGSKRQVKVQLKTSEQFITDVVQGIRAQRMEEVRRAYRACDVLLIDDIQFISGKEVCQEEFFHTFNALYDAQKQIVVTSDRLPHEIADIQERVRTRFAWGLIADLKLPELETRIAILKKKAEAEGIELDDAVASFIAQSVRTNIRELEGCLIRVHAFASLTKQPITMATARDVLKGLISDKVRTLNCEVIVKTVAAVFDVKVSDLKSSKRGRAIALPRQVAMYLCRKHTASSYPEIGQALGGKDHTTALNAYNRIGERLTEAEIRSKVEEIERTLLE